MSHSVLNGFAAPLCGGGPGCGSAALLWGKALPFRQGAKD